MDPILVLGLPARLWRTTVKWTTWSCCVEHLHDLFLRSVSSIFGYVSKRGDFLPCGETEGFVINEGIANPNPERVANIVS